MVRISVDSFGFFALSCYEDAKVYLYDVNLKYASKSIVFGNVYDARIDTNNRFAICGGGNSGNREIT